MVFPRSRCSSRAAVPGPFPQGAGGSAQKHSLAAFPAAESRSGALGQEREAQREAESWERGGERESAGKKRGWERREDGVAAAWRRHHGRLLPAAPCGCSSTAVRDPSQGWTRLNHQRRGRREHKRLAAYHTKNSILARHGDTGPTGHPGEGAKAGTQPPQQPWTDAGARQPCCERQCWLLRNGSSGRGHRSATGPTVPTRQWARCCQVTRGVCSIPLLGILV